MDQSQPPDPFRFLEKSIRVSEDTEFDPGDQHYIETPIRLAEKYHKEAIIEDFNKPFLHHTETIRKNTKELKDLVRHALQRR